jgi:hypothetical protein
MLAPRLRLLGLLCLAHLPVLAGCQFGVSLDQLQAGGPAEGSGGNSTLDGSHPDASLPDSAQADDMRSEGDATSTGDAASTGFPSASSRLLDNFDSSMVMLGPQWTGDVMSFTAMGGQLVVTKDSCNASTPGNAVLEWVGNLRAPPQEAFFRVLKVALGTTEIDLVLDAQSMDRCNQVEVSFRPETHVVQVDFCLDGGWTDVGAAIPIAIDPGDQLGARLDANGVVSVYRNGLLLGTRTITQWNLLPHQGRIGLSTCGDSGTILDDFGGTP